MRTPPASVGRVLQRHLDHVRRLVGHEAVEGEHGALSRATEMAQAALGVQEARLAAEPDDEVTARDVSCRLNKVADVLAQRGQAGDALAALENCERSLQLRVALLRDNTGSAPAAHTVAVLCERIASLPGGTGLPAGPDPSLQRPGAGPATATPAEPTRQLLHGAFTAGHGLGIGKAGASG